MANMYPIDRNYLQTQKVAFNPESEDEALRIQQKLALAGVRWTDGDRVGACLPECVDDGMYVENGILLTDSSKDDRDKYSRPCEDILNVADDDLMSTEDKLYRLIRAQAAEITALNAKVDMLVEALVPRVLDKGLLLDVAPLPKRQKTIRGIS